MVSGEGVDLGQRPTWRLVDKLLAAYGILVALLAFTRWHQPGAPAVAITHLAIPALAWLVVNAPSTPLIRWLRNLYPILLLVGLYSAIDVLNRFGAVPTWDHQIQAIEQAIFGMQPSRDWWRAHPSAFWSATLHAAYLSYYPLIVIPIVTFMVQRRSDALERYLNGVIATYLVCYLFALFLPVSGPYYQFDRPTGEFVANLPARLVYATLNAGSAFGAAFPSSHVAATVAATIGAWHGSRRLGLVIAIPTALIAVGVVYCQMHYAIDSAAGVLTGVVVAGFVTRRN
jgi:membrane-associated phospholipid phosphatase